MKTYEKIIRCVDTLKTPFTSRQVAERAGCPQHTVAAVFAGIGRDFIKKVGKSKKDRRAAEYFKTDRWDKNEVMSRWFTPKSPVPVVETGKKISSSLHVTSSKQRSKISAGFKKSLDKAEKLLRQRWYSEAIGEYGKVLEHLLRNLYRKYLPYLPYDHKEKAVNFEKDMQKSTHKFTIGEWVGLFQSARLLDFISQERIGKDEHFIFFTKSMMHTIKTIRNISTHPTSKSEHYITKDVALFVRSAIRCILYELGE